MKQNFKIFFRMQRGFISKPLFILILLFSGNSFVSKSYADSKKNDVIEEKQNSDKPKIQEVVTQPEDKSKIQEVATQSKDKAKTQELANQPKDKAKTNEKSPKVKKNASYSFRPLLIQGKKRLIQKTKDMKMDSGNIAESKLFFIDIDFKKRIFDHEGSK